MDWLNYHHLLYFCTVVREGGMSRAAEKLRLAQPTISAQVRQLEEVVGQPLFERQGRRLVLTEVGRLVYEYADQIFNLGQEMLETLKGRPAGRPLRLRVGVSNAVPKLLVQRMLRPALAGPHTVQLFCREDQPDRLLTELANHALDVIISDTPAPPHVRVKVFNHPLGQSSVSFLAVPPLAARLRRAFPRSLHGAPMLLPSPGSMLRRTLDQWFETQQIRPLITGEFDDTALMKTFGQEAAAVFPSPTVIETEVIRQYGVKVVGRAPEAVERYYAISAERRITHPGVVAVTGAARTDTFAGGGPPHP